MHPNYFLQPFFPESGISLTWGHNLNPLLMGFPPLRESCLYTPKRDVARMKVLGQIGLWSFLGLPAGTEILHGGISPTRRPDSAAGISFSEIWFRNYLMGRAPLGIKHESNPVIGIPPSKVQSIAGIFPPLGHDIYMYRCGINNHMGITRQINP